MSAGNGSLMRLSPVAIRYWQDDAIRRDVAARQCRTTHGAPEAVDACVVFADMLAEAIAGRPRHEVMRPRQEPFAGRISEVLAGSWRGHTRKTIRSSGYVIDSLEPALWCVARSKRICYRLRFNDELYSNPAFRSRGAAKLRSNSAGEMARIPYSICRLASFPISSS